MLKEKIQTIIQEDEYAKHLQFTLEEWKEGYARTSVIVNEQHTNFHGATNGGLLFSLADYAFAIASNSDGEIAVGIDTSMSFIKASKVGDKLTCIATEDHKGGKLAMYQMKIFNEEEVLIAKMQGTVYRTRRNYV